MRNEVESLEIKEEIPEADGMIAKEARSTQRPIAFRLQHAFHFFTKSQRTQVWNDHRLRMRRAETGLTNEVGRE